MSKIDTFFCVLCGAVPFILAGGVLLVVVLFLREALK